MDQYQQVPPPAYNQAPPLPMPVGTSGWAIFSLISGILAWLGVFGLGGIAAVIAGMIAKNEINKSGGRLGGGGMATAGLVLGWVNIAFACLGLCLALLIFTGVLTSPAFCAPFFNGINSNFQTVP